MSHLAPELYSVFISVKKLKRVNGILWQESSVAGGEDCYRH